MAGHASLAAPDTDSAGADRRRAQVDAPQRIGSSGTQKSRASIDEGEGVAGDRSQVVMDQINESMKMTVAIVQTLKEQQSDQRAGQALQMAAVESIHRVGDAMTEAAKGRHKEESKTILSSLKHMNFQEKLTTEVVNDAAKYKLWMRRFETWISSQAGSSSLEVDPFFKKIRAATPQVTTKELFEELKKGNAEQAAQWIRLS